MNEPSLGEGTRLRAAGEATRTPGPEPSLVGVDRVAVGRARIHLMNPSAAADAVCDLAASGGSSYVVTPNISHIVMLESDENFRNAYAGAALVVPDGWPVARAMTLFTGRRQARVNGTELTLQALRRAAERGLSVAFVGGHADAAVRCSETARSLFPSLNICLADPAPSDCIADERCFETLLERIRVAAPDLLVLGLGAPKQELLAASHVFHAGTILNVGSAIELIAGVRRRAPIAWRAAGLEWLFRLVQEPRRLGRRYLRDAPRFVAIVARQARTRPYRDSK